MTPDEARELTGFLKGAFQNLTPEQIDVYESSLLFEDAELASKAILDGIREWKFPPRYAEIVERIRVLKREVAPPEPEPEVFVREIPFWVRVWVVARFLTKPPDLRPFPQEYPSGDGQLPRGATEWIEQSTYEERAKSVTDGRVMAAVAAVTQGAVPSLDAALAEVE